MLVFKGRHISSEYFPTFWQHSQASPQHPTYRGIEWKGWTPNTQKHHPYCHTLTKRQKTVKNSELGFTICLTFIVKVTISHDEPDLEIVEIAILIMISGGKRPHRVHFTGFRDTQCARFHMWNRGRWVTLNPGDSVCVSGRRLDGGDSSRDSSSTGARVSRLRG